LIWSGKLAIGCWRAHRTSILARCSRSLARHPAHRSTGVRQRTRSEPRGCCLGWEAGLLCVQFKSDSSVVIDGHDEVAGLPGANAVYRQTWHTRTETVWPDRVKRRDV